MEAPGFALFMLGVLTMALISGAAIFLHKRGF